MGKKLLVTGANGLVGSHITSDVKIGREVDLTNPQLTLQSFETNKPTHIIHCAGKVGGLGGNMNYKGEYFYDNIMVKYPTTKDDWASEI
jgi:GDP-L-fucose synthase